MTEKDDVKSVDCPCNSLHCVLVVVESADTPVPSAVEQSYYDISIFLLLYVPYPFFCA